MKGVKRPKTARQQLVEELKRRRGEAWAWVQVLPNPPPAKWKPRVIPLERFIAEVGVKPLYPELWDLCVGFLKDFDCYQKAVEIWHNKDYQAVVLRAVMFGADVKAVIEALRAGQYQRARELAYRGKMPVQQLDEVMKGRP